MAPEGALEKWRKCQSPIDASSFVVQSESTVQLETYWTVPFRRASEEAPEVR